MSKKKSSNSLKKIRKQGHFVVIRYCLNCGDYYEVFLNTDEEIQQAMINGENIIFIDN